MIKEILKKIYISIYKILFNMFYVTMNSLKRHDDMKAIFVMSRENKLQGNLQYVYLELKQQLPNVKIHFVYAENKMNLKLFKELIKIGNARYLLLDDYYLPIYLIKPDERLKVVQLWHAAGAFKKFGLSTIGAKFGPKESYLKLVPIHSNYTHVYVSSENVVPYYAEAFNMSTDNIFPLGIPRIDLFSKDKFKNIIKNTLYTRYPNLQKNSDVNILIAPTYRATGAQGESEFNMTNVLIEIYPLLKLNIKIIYRPHPYTSKHELSFLHGYDNILVANDYSLNEWMLVSDVFITDYSSAVFEFAILEKPFAHFVPDINYYGKNRGFYQDINKISDGDLLYNKDDLIEWINKRGKLECFDTNCMVKYNFSNIEGVTNKIVRHFITTDLGGAQSARISN